MHKLMQAAARGRLATDITVPLITQFAFTTLCRAIILYLCILPLPSPFFFNNLQVGTPGTSWYEVVTSYKVLEK